MKKIFQYIMLAVVTIVMASCASDIEETTATISNDNIKFVVGDFPAFEDSQTRTIGTQDAGKTSWEDGDELLIKLLNSTYSGQYYTLVKTSSGWEVSGNQTFRYKEGETPSIRAYYAPGYIWENGYTELKNANDAGKDECIGVDCELTGENKDVIKIPFNSAQRTYSRLRIATIPNTSIMVETKSFRPSGQVYIDNITYSLTSDAKGNAYLYGKFEDYSSVTVKYKEATLASYAFTQETTNGTSYALDATAVSLVGMSAENIKKEIKKKLDAGKTDINLILASDADITVFENIKSGLGNASVGSINLTLLGCNKIPSKGLQNCDKLKSIAIPDVTEIEEDAFSDCKYLQKVVLGNITKAYGRAGSNGIFEGSDSKSIYLVLSEEQKYMNYRKIDGRYCWTTVDTKYIDSSSHITREFLSYEYKSVTCGTKTYN